MVGKCVSRLAREFMKMKCRFCAGDTITSDGEYRKRPDSENKHWATDGVDYHNCGLSGLDRKMLDEVREL